MKFGWTGDTGEFMEIDIQKIYVPSQDLVAREIEDQLVIIPITLENLDFEDAIYTFNESGREIWQRLDKHLPLSQIIDELHQEYEVSKEKNDRRCHRVDRGTDKKENRSG